MRRKGYVRKARFSKSKALTLLLALGVLFSFQLSFSRRESSPGFQPAPSIRPKALALPQPLSFLQMPKLPEESCAEDWTFILEFDSKTIQRETAESIFEKVKGCPLKSRYIAAAMRGVYSNCTRRGLERSYKRAQEQILANERITVDLSTLRLPEDEVLRTCRVAFQDLQRSLVAGQVDFSNLEGETNLKALKSFLYVANVGDNVHRWRTAANRILSLDPSNDTVSQMYMTYLIHDVMFNRNQNDPQAWNRNEHDLAWAVSFLPKDHPKKPEWELFRYSHSLEEGFLEEAGQRVINEYPGSGMGWYALSASAWKRDNWSEATSHIRQALKLEPTNQRYKSVLYALKSHKDPEYSFGSFPNLDQLVAD